ncbi:MAG TPA: response regulator [Vitreimonas sp.]|uniref:response regulator n=1 Tax=Vitreimonas sp. TaxID=3069702 RepID=UPI002D55B22F|nr:response regulator [Vitreimonas sp.]HYD88813.1 response regulator [Vitreimonas sp.]
MRSGRINLALASVLLLDASDHNLDILTQVLKGLGAQDVHRCLTIAEAERVINRIAVDLIIVDPNLKKEDGHSFVEWVRRSTPDPTRAVPIIMISGYSTLTTVHRARDAGANFFVAKPITPKVLLDRILWIGRDNRNFIEVASGYCGPERRFKFEGPPPGCEGRRHDDLKAPIGDSMTPNMSQDEVNTMIKPQRVQL